MDTIADLNQVKEFLLLFNKLSERCFQRCVYSMGQATLQPDESSCIDTCITKSVNCNQKLLSLYMEIQPPFQQQIMEAQMAEVEAMKKAQALAMEKEASAAVDTA